VPVLLDLGGAGTRTRTLAVYDVHGRLVRRWRVTAGHGARAAWDGRAAGGSRAGPGIYFIRAEGSGESSRAAKVVVTR